LVAALHVLAFAAAFPLAFSWEDLLPATAGQTSLRLSLAVAALIVLSYAIAPLVPALRSVLDGWVLPDRLHDMLRWPRVRRNRELLRRRASAVTTYAAFYRIRRVERPKLSGAALTGNALEAVRNTGDIDAAVKRVDALQAQMELGLPDPAEFRAALDALRTALKTNAVNLASSDRHAARLAKARETLRSLIDEGEDEARYALVRASEKCNRHTLLPTRIGDARVRTESYSRDSYHVEFDFIWPRIQMLLPKPDETGHDFNERLNDAQSQVSFAVLSFVLTLTVPLVWLPLLAALSTTLWLFLLVAVASPPVLVLLYELVVQSQRTFGDVVRVAIDMYRHRVLAEILHQPAPATLSTERQLWERLAAAAERQNEVDLVFSPAGTPE
jgi:hypothetical protein